MSAVTKHIQVNQINRSVIVFVHRSNGMEHLKTRAYYADPGDRTQDFIFRRFARGVRMMNASLRREWGQS